MRRYIDFLKGNMNVVNAHLNNTEFNVIYQAFIHILLISLNKLTHVFDHTYNKLPEIFALSFQRHIFSCQIMSIINEKVKQKTVANDLQDIMIVAQQIYPTIVFCRNYLSFSIQEESLLL